MDNSSLRLQKISKFNFFDSFQVFLDMPQAMLEKLLNLPDDYVDPPNASNSTLSSVVLVLASLVFVFLAVFYKNNVWNQNF